MKEHRAEAERLAMSALHVCQAIVTIIEEEAIGSPRLSAYLGQLSIRTGRVINDIYDLTFREIENLAAAIEKSKVSQKE